MKANNRLNNLKSNALPESAIYFFIRSGYFILVRDNPCAGADAPALFLSLLSIISRNSTIDIFSYPISRSVPTIALTMFRKNRSAAIININ